MQQPLLVRTADVAAQPWRNGGGVTRELLALPAGDDDWRVRISVADVASDGPFSSFPGIDRWFAVLDGAGVVLTIDGAAQRIGAADAPVAFPGDAQTQCRLIDGPTRDLNLMLRGIAGALVRVVAGATWRPQASACGLYATSAGTCGAAVDAGTLCWWNDAPPALVFDGSGCWIAVGAPDAARSSIDERPRRDRRVDDDARRATR